MSACQLVPAPCVACVPERRSVAAAPAPVSRSTYSTVLRPRRAVPRPAERRFLVGRDRGETRAPGEGQTPTERAQSHLSKTLLSSLVSSLSPAVPVGPNSEARVGLLGT